MSDTAYVIRLATADDVPGLPSVERQAVGLFEGWFEETGLTRAMLDDVSTVEELAAAQRLGHLWVGAPSDGEVAGFAQVVILDGTAHLDEVDVVPDHGRNGLGSRLVEAICAWATSAGYPSVTLSTFRHVPWNQPFYERRGFRVVDADALGPDHRKMVATERARGLRTDLRTVMVRRLTQDS